MFEEFKRTFRKQTELHCDFYKEVTQLRLLRITRVLHPSLQVLQSAQLISDTNSKRTLDSPIALFRHHFSHSYT